MPFQEVWKGILKNNTADQFTKGKGLVIFAHNFFVNRNSIFITI